MAQLTRSTKISGGTTLQANTLARSADVETDMLTLFNAHNNHDTGTSKWGVVSSLSATTCPLIADNSTGTNDIMNLKDNSTTVLTVADGGIVTVAPGGTTKAVINSTGVTLSNSATLAMGGAKITGLAAATATGDALRYEQLLTTDVTLAGNLIFNPTTKGIKGTTTNDNTSAGDVGEYVSLTVGAVSFPSTGTYGDYGSISLTAGDWDVSVIAMLNRNGATATNYQVGTSITSGNSATGLVAGDSEASFSGTTALATINEMAFAVPAVRMSLAGTTTVYIKFLATYSAGTPQLSFGRISARRVR